MSFEIQEYEIKTVEVTSQVDPVSAQLEHTCDMADNIEVTDIHGLNNALEAIDYLSNVTKVLEDIVEPFRKKAYDHYVSIREEKKKLLSRPQATVAALRGKIKDFNDRVEREKQLAMEALAKDNQTPEAMAVIEAPSVTQDVEGLGWRVQWSAELATDDGEALKALCRAIGDGKAPVNLVTFNQSEANRLAKSLKDLMRYPGVRAKREKVPVISKVR